MKNTRDVNSKTIFHDPILCSQFLRDNVDIPLLKNVQPEDIEDVSARYLAFLGTEFEADTVKKIRIREGEQDTPVYMISLIDLEITSPILATDSSESMITPMKNCCFVKTKYLLS